MKPLSTQLLYRLLPLIPLLPAFASAESDSRYSSYSSGDSLSSYSSPNGSIYYKTPSTYTSTFSSETESATNTPSNYTSSTPAPQSEPNGRLNHDTPYALPVNPASYEINWLSNYSEASSLSRTTSKPIVILFTGTSWCPACIQLERNVLSRPEFAAAVSAHFVFLKAEFPSYSLSSMNSSPFKPLLDRYSITAFPSIVVVDATGKQLFTVNYRDSSPMDYAQELMRKAGKR